jgi:hypothetical protein
VKISVSTSDFSIVADGMEGDIAKAATDAMRTTTPIAKSELRDQVLRAGLGGRLANTWRGNAYPRTGRSMAPAGYIWSNAPEIVDSFVRGAQIVPLAGRKYLAIPTNNVPRAIGRRGATQRMTPEQVETAFNQDLFFKRGRDGHVLAFINAVRSKNRKGWRQGTKARLKQGRNIKPVLMFVLVRAVRMPKLLDLNEPAERWASAYAAALQRNLEDR